MCMNIINIKVRNLQYEDLNLILVICKCKCKYEYLLKIFIKRIKFFTFEVIYIYVNIEKRFKIWSAGFYYIEILRC